MSMHMSSVLVLLMVFLVLLVAGVLVAMRLYGDRETRDDHPH